MNYAILKTGKLDGRTALTGCGSPQATHLQAVFYVHVTVHRNKFLFNKTNRRTNFPNLFCHETVHVSGSSCAHQQEFTTLRSALDDSFQARPWSCLKAVIKPARHIPVPNVQWKTRDDGQRNCPKHVEFLDKINLGKLVRLLVLLKRGLQCVKK